MTHLDKYETLKLELDAIFADCNTESELRCERHRLTDVLTRAALDRLTAIIKTESEAKKPL